MIDDDVLTNVGHKPTSATSFVFAPERTSNSGEFAMRSEVPVSCHFFQRILQPHFCLN